MKTGSLFTGIGGKDLGFEQAGFEIVWQVENDEFCKRVLERHWPTVRRWDDVRTFLSSSAESWQVDCLIGGFPCKQTSNGAAIHGKRTGLAGADSGLWWHMLRVIRTLRPGWVSIENPTGAKTWAKTIEGCLADAGYSVQRLELEAADFGAPHRRRRVFWIANRNGTRPQIARPCRSSTAEGHARGAADRDFGLPPLPGTLRVADGVPGGLDRRKRIEAIGNAVYPPMAKYVAECIASSGRAPDQQPPTAQ